MSNCIVLDTETTGLEKPFCYDLSYVVMEQETGKIIAFSANVVEQVWHNLPLFESAYYKQKRQKYVLMLRRREAQMDKWGYIMQRLARDIKKYDVKAVYAYNSDFDDKVIAYNCEWFKCNNPLDATPVYDIWGYASEFITCSPDYRKFCEDNSLFTESGNYKGSAESVYQYLKNDPTFVEEHMGLFDSQIEAAILAWCVIMEGAEWETEYTVKRILSRPTAKPFTIQINGTPIYSGEYVKKVVRKDTYNFKTP